MMDPTANATAAATSAVSEERSQRDRHRHGPSPRAAVGVTGAATVRATPNRPRSAALRERRSPPRLKTAAVTVHHGRGPRARAHCATRDHVEPNSSRTLGAAPLTGPVHVAVVLGMAWVDVTYRLGWIGPTRRNRPRNGSGPVAVQGSAIENASGTDPSAGAAALNRNAAGQRRVSARSATPAPRGGRWPNSSVRAGPSPRTGAGWPQRRRRACRRS